jgi:hypothetical protein
MMTSPQDVDENINITNKYLLRIIETQDARVLESLSLTRTGKILSVWKPSTTGVFNIEAYPAGTLLSFVAAVSEPRRWHGRQDRLMAILALMCCAITCVAKSYTAIAEWARDQAIGLMHRLGFTRKPPKMGGIRKVLIALNPKAFKDALNRRADSLLGRPVSNELSPPGAFVIDG